ncbi:hypothetical protein [Bacillus sp. NPDC077027]|uniref:hypothetical protein n=1 Tax=Bacillus sp. NPDC077027 TaxID=3390548 RepID=UPI003D088FAA
MNMSGKAIIGLILMLLGLSIFFGGSVGGIIPSIIGAWLIYVGVKKYDKGNKIGGVIIAIIGLMMLVHFLPLLISIVLALALFYFGWKLMNVESSRSHRRSYREAETVPHSEDKFESSFDQEWEDFLKKK